MSAVQLGLCTWLEAVWVAETRNISGNVGNYKLLLGRNSPFLPALSVEQWQDVRIKTVPVRKLSGSAGQFRDVVLGFQHLDVRVAV